MGKVTYEFDENKESRDIESLRVSFPDACVVAN